MNVDFLKKEGVTHIVNTAKGLKIFGPKYTVSEFSRSLVTQSFSVQHQKAAWE